MEIPSACMRRGIKACSMPLPAWSKVVAAVMVQIRAREEFTIESVMRGGGREGQQDREQAPPKIKSRSGSYRWSSVVGMPGDGPGMLADAPGALPVRAVLLEGGEQIEAVEA